MFVSVEVFYELNKKLKWFKDYSSSILKMSSPMIIDGVNFDTSDVKYSAPKMNASGGKSIGILNAKSNKALYVESPAMMQWGIKDWEGNEKFNMTLQFYNPEYEENEDQAKFLKNMIAFEDKLKEDAVKNSKEWFGKPKMTPDMVEVLFSSKIKYPKDKNTGEPNGKPPTLDARIPYYDGTWRTEVYDTDGQCLFPNNDDADITPQTLVAKGSKVVTILQCGGLWFANGKFGVTWKLYQTVAKPYQSLKGKCHIKLSSKLDEQVTSDDIDDAEESSDDVAQVATVDDSDEEEEEVVASAPVVEVQPEPEAPKKKRVVKKVVKKSVSAEAEA